MHSQKETFFGFKKVPFAEKATLVEKVFSAVADKYDIMNDVMSLGIHRFWKKQFTDQIVDFLRLTSEQKMIDVAGGTGDIAIKCYKRLKKLGCTSNIILCDINNEMLTVGRDKAIDSNILRGMSYVQGDAEKLPFASETFDCYSIAFGIRNVTDIDAALSESFRVLKPGGKLFCLEFSKVDNEIVEKFYDVYSFNIIPKIGECIAGNRDAYEYLSESIRKFPDQDTFSQMIQNAGYKNVHYQNFTFGVVAIHTAYKPC